MLKILGVPVSVHTRKVIVAAVFLQPPDAERMHESVVEMQFPVRRRDN